jgi:hypothetical protein
MKGKYQLILKISICLVCVIISEVLGSIHNNNIGKTSNEQLQNFEVERLTEYFSNFKSENYNQIFNRNTKITNVKTETHLCSKFVKPFIPLTIDPTLRVNIPQSFLGTCEISDATEFNLATWGISPCVGLTYFVKCSNNKSFTMLSHLDSSHKNNMINYIETFLSKIPASCGSGKFTINLANPMDDLPKKIQEALNHFHQEFEVKTHICHDLGVDIAIETKEGTIKKYKNLGPETPSGETTLAAFFNKIGDDCKIYYIGKNRLCKLEPDYKLAYTFERALYDFNYSNPDGFIYAYRPSENPSDAEDCRREDIDVKSK